MSLDVGILWILVSKRINKSRRENHYLLVMLVSVRPCTTCINSDFPHLDLFMRLETRIHKIPTYTYSYYDNTSNITDTGQLLRQENAVVVLNCSVMYLQCAVLATISDYILPYFCCSRLC